MAALRVLHLTTEFPPVIYGGLGTAVGGLVAASHFAEVDAGVLLIGWEGVGGYGPAPQSLTTAPLFSAAPSASAEWIADLVRRWNPAVLHLHSFWLWPLAQALRTALRIPIVYTVHSLDRAEYELGGGPSECVTQWFDQAAVVEGADRVIALSQSERELLLEYCPAVAGRVHVVGNGIANVTASARSETTDCKVLFVGRFVARKGIHELIAAMRRVLAEAPTVTFTLAGGHRDCSGEDMRRWLMPPELERFRERIRFTGWLSPGDVEALYRASDVLVVPSWYEPFGMVVLEGMLHGLAIAASRIGGPAEILSHGKTGYLFPPQDPVALSQAILTLSRDGNLRRRLARKGARHVREHWLWPQSVKRMRTVYEGAIAPIAKMSSHAWTPSPAPGPPPLRP